MHSTCRFYLAPLPLHAKASCSISALPHHAPTVNRTVLAYVDSLEVLYVAAKAARSRSVVSRASGEPETGQTGHLDFINRSRNVTADRLLLFIDL